MPNLQNWVHEARQHWKEHLPTRFAALKKAGKLDSSLQEAANQTYLELQQLEDSGLTPEEAWQMVREEYLFPRAESDGAATSSEPMTHRMLQAMRSGSREMKIG